MSLYISISLLVLLIALLYFFKDRVLLFMFNSKKSKYIFIASYIIKTSKAIMVDQNLSIYLAILLNKKFTDCVEDSDVKEQYILFYKSYLINYYDSELVDEIGYDGIVTEDSIRFIEEKSGKEIEYADGGVEKLALVQYVLEEFGNDPQIFSKSLTKISSDLITIIQSRKAE